MVPTWFQLGSAWRLIARLQQNAPCFLGSDMVPAWLLLVSAWRLIAKLYKNATCLLGSGLVPSWFHSKHNMFGWFRLDSTWIRTASCHQYFRSLCYSLLSFDCASMEDTKHIMLAWTHIAVLGTTSRDVTTQQRCLGSSLVPLGSASGDVGNDIAIIKFPRQGFC